MKKYVCAALVSVSLLSLPGCFGEGTKETTASTSRPSAPKKTGTPIITIDGNVVVTEPELNEYIDMYIQAQQQQMPGFDFKAVLNQLPADQKRGFYEGIVKMLEDASLIQADVEAQGLTKSAEYQKNLQKLYEELERNLAQIEFQKRLAGDIKPAAKEVEAFYLAERASNPFMQREPFITKQGGVDAVVVKAKDEAQAKALVDSAKVRGLEKAAIEVGAKAEKAIVNAQNTKWAREVVNKVLGATKFPTVESVKADNAWYVVEAKNQAPAEYASIEKVKQQVEEIYLNTMFAQRYQDEISKIKAKHKVEVNSKIVDKLAK